MDPDYYKINNKKMYAHELDRLSEMNDKDLYTRYGKMTKEDKIGAFYEALTDKNRVPKLRKQMEGKRGIPAKGHTKASRVKENITMNFVRVVKNNDDCKQAVFLQPESGQHYFYSYINNEHGHETMVFECDDKGDVVHHKDIVSASGYENSSDMMDRLMEKL